MERHLLDEGVGMEGGSSRSIQERKEDAGLFRQNADGLEWAKVDEVQKLVHRRSRGQVADIDGTTNDVAIGRHPSGHRDG